MTAAIVALRPSGRGRQPAAAEAERSAHDELTALRADVLAFVDNAWPHLSALERMAAELGPVALRHALTLGSLLTRLEHQQLADDERGEAAA